MPGEDLIRTLLQYATTSGSRSTALQPLTWLVGLLLAALVFSVGHTSGWVIILLAICVGFALLLFAGCYIYLMIRNPDALRSERFGLSKLAMEKSIKGDDLRGFLAVDDGPSPPQLPAKSEDPR